MKKLILLLSLFCSLNASAVVMNYRLYEDSIQKFTPFVLSIEIDGPFQVGSKIKKMQLTMSSALQSTLLFSWEKNLNQVIRYQWNADGSLSLNAPNSESFKAKVKKKISNTWGDTDINPTDSYSVYFDREIILYPNGSANEVRFEITNNTVEESCLWGSLKL